MIWSYGDLAHVISSRYFTSEMLLPSICNICVCVLCFTILDYFLKKCYNRLQKKIRKMCRVCIYIYKKGRQPGDLYAVRQPSALSGPFEPLLLHLHPFIFFLYIKFIFIRKIILT